MDSAERAFIIAKWIAIIGLLPIVYLFTAWPVFMIIGMLIGDIATYILAIIGFFILLYFIIRREKNYIPMKQINDKFLFGVFLIFIGHLGLVAVYTLFIFEGSSVAVLISIPAIIWMILFYLIGFSIVDKQKYLERLREKNELENHT